MGMLPKEPMRPLSGGMPRIGSQGGSLMLSAVGLRGGGTMDVGGGGISGPPLAGGVGPAVAASAASFGRSRLYNIATKI